MAIDIRICDNLDLMADIQDSEVDLIYCDILYGTGRNFGEYQDLKPKRDVIERHYLLRFVEMKRVLKPRGTIYIHTGLNTAHWIRCLLDDVFGYSNFRNEIVWAYNSAPRKKHCFGNRHDIIYRYSLSDDFTFNPIREPYSDTAPRGYEKEKYYHNEGKVVGDVWDIKMLGQNDRTERNGYPTQKPKALIERIIKTSSNEGELVADFYAGSFTTAEVCKDLNRRFIGCDINPNCFEKAKERGLF